MEQNKTKPAQNPNKEQNATSNESQAEVQVADSKKKNSFQEKMKKKMQNKNTPDAYLPDQPDAINTPEAVAPSLPLPVNPQPQSKLLQELSQPQNNNQGMTLQQPHMVFQMQPQMYPQMMPVFYTPQQPGYPQFYMQPLAFMPQPQQMMPAQTDLPPADQASYEFMLNQLIANGQNVAPNVFNQVSPGEEGSQNIEPPPKLQDWMQDLDEDDLQQMAEMLNEQEFINQEFMGNGSYHHTYSDMREDDSKDHHLDDEDYDEAENPHMWQDPEGNKRREEARKNIFNAMFKDCDCCKGFISNCSNALCKNLGICHCVARKQNEEANEPEEKIFVEEYQSCTCCKGYVLSCEGTECQARMSCVCQK